MVDEIQLNRRSVAYADACLHAARALAVLKSLDRSDERVYVPDIDDDHDDNVSVLTNIVQRFSNMAHGAAGDAFKSAAIVHPEIQSKECVESFFGRYNEWFRDRLNPPMQKSAEPATVPEPAPQLPDTVALTIAIGNLTPVISNLVDTLLLPKSKKIEMTDDGVTTTAIIREIREMAGAQ